MRIGTLTLILIISFTIFNCENAVDPQPIDSTFLGQITPEQTPIRFAEQVIGNSIYPHSILIISPNNQKIFWSTFLDTVSGNLALYYSDFNGRELLEPLEDIELKIYGIDSFIFWNDENHILFGSQQPYSNLDNRLVYAVWTSEKTNIGWSIPQPIESTLDTDWVSLGSVTVNSKGDIYFVGRLQGDDAKIYCTKFVNNIYLGYEPLPQIINTGVAMDPFIDYRDEYLLFAAYGRQSNIGIIDLYISFKNDNSNWLEPINLGEQINTKYMNRFPSVSANGKYLFFVTSHSNYFPSTYTHYYWVDAGIINSITPLK